MMAPVYANLSLIVATVQQLLSQTTALVLQQNGTAVLQEEMLETLERDTRRAMMQLRRFRNYSPALPINRLPPEVLRMVFGHLRHQPVPRRPRHLTASRFAPYNLLIAAMLVCHKWYTITSQAASLWTDIDFAHQHTFASKLLARSLDAPIRLCGRLTNEDNALERIIKDNNDRIRELDLWSKGPTPALQSILAVDMPRIGIISLLCEDTIPSTAESPLIINSQASFLVLKAALLENLLFVPAHVLPQLTHLRLAELKKINISDVLDILRNTPALEVLHVSHCRDLIIPPTSVTETSPSVSLPCLQSLLLRILTSAAAQYLMIPLEVPNLTFLHVSTFLATNSALPSKPFLPGALATRSMDRFAFDLGENFAHFRTMIQGKDISLALDVGAIGVQEAERSRWGFHDFPNMLPLSGIQELHFLARQWDAPGDILPHIATRMPAVSKLLLKHEPGAHSDGEDVKGHMELARTVVRILASHRPGPVLFPNLSHLELIVMDIPLAFCELIAPALAQRDLDGRRLRKLRIRVDDDYSFGSWEPKWMQRREPEYKKTGIFDHVDSGEIYPKQRGSEDHGDGSDRDEHPFRPGWGKWKDSVQRARHGYWRE